MTHVTTTDAWARLTELKENFTPDLRGWFAADPGRAEHFTRTAGDLHVDLSKNLVNDAVVDALVPEALQRTVRDKINDRRALTEVDAQGRSAYLQRVERQANSHASQSDSEVTP